MTWAVVDVRRLEVRIFICVEIARQGAVCRVDDVFVLEGALACDLGTVGREGSALPCLEAIHDGICRRAKETVSGSRERKRAADRGPVEKCPGRDAGGYRGTRLFGEGAAEPLGG